MASHTIKFRQKLSLSFKEGKVSGMQQTCLLLAPKYEELASLLAIQKESNWRALIQRCRAAIYNTHPLAGKRKASAFTSQGRALQLTRMAWGEKAVCTLCSQVLSASKNIVIITRIIYVFEPDSSSSSLFFFMIFIVTIATISLVITSSTTISDIHKQRRLTNGCGRWIHLIFGPLLIWQVPKNG